MKIAVNSSPRGIALIIVMVSILVIATLAGGFAYSMKVETKLARNANSETEMEWLGRSGVEYARWYYAELLKTPGQNRSPWPGVLVGFGISNSPAASVDLHAPVKLGNGTFSIKNVTDLESKVNINCADQSILERALVLMGVGTGDPARIVGSILDWIDPDQMTHPGGGTESVHYQSLDPPYVAKNGRIDDLSEMLLIRGITPEIYWGPAFPDHYPSTADPPILPPFGLVDIFTPLSSGKININTASTNVLQTIPMIDPNIAFLIENQRNLLPFQNVGELVNVGLPPVVVQVLFNYCVVSSRMFEVQVEVEVGGYPRWFYAVLGSNGPKDIQVLSFYWKDLPEGK